MTKRSDGVYYRVQITYNGKHQSFSCHQDPKQAAKTADVIAETLFGDILSEEDYNFPGEKRDIMTIKPKWRERVKALLK